VIDDQGRLIGVVTRRDLLRRGLPGDALVVSLVRRPPLVVEENHSLREAADHMVEADVSRLVVVSPEDSHRMVGILTRGDLLAAHAQRLREAHSATRHLGKKKAV
jgi:CBS domain-containing protein